MVASMAFTALPGTVWATAMAPATSTSAGNSPPVDGGAPPVHLLVDVDPRHAGAVPGYSHLHPEPSLERREELRGNFELALHQPNLALEPPHHDVSKFFS